MNKTELIAKISEKSGLNKKQAEAALTAFTDSVMETLKEGDKVTLVGFGSFEVKHRAARTAHKPSTGEIIEVAEKNIPVFKAGKKFKDQF